LSFRAIRGHEIGGRIDAVGSDVTQWEKGQRVGVGWHGGHDFVCDQCRRGDFAMCVNRKITGIDFDGGYAEYMIVGAEDNGCRSYKSASPHHNKRDWCPRLPGHDKRRSYLPVDREL
jgi:D-arabinose 1-dehydrogenase-like Zn-dependent alcohol dehydrogenase